MKRTALMSLALAAALTGLADGMVVVFRGPQEPYVGRWPTTTASGSYSSSSGLTDYFDASRDFYIETVQRFDRYEDVNGIAGFGPIDLRFLRSITQIQGKWISQGATQYMYAGGKAAERYKWPTGESHHFIAISTNHIFRCYMDGQLIFTSNYQTSYSNTWADCNDRWTKDVSFQPHHDIRLFRVGYLACLTNGAPAEGVVTDPDALAKCHFNWGQPLRWKDDDEVGRIIDIHEADMTLTSAVNRVNGRILTPSAALAKTLSWATDDPYAPRLADEGAPAKAPRYCGQYYQDTLSGRWYKSRGMNVPGDWRAYAYMSDLNEFELRQLDGVSLLGTGDVAISAVPYREVVDASVCGAAGDGVTDDSAAIAEAVRQAKAGGKAVYLPMTAGGGRYRVSSPVALEGGMRLKGENGVRIASTGACLAITGEGAVVDNLAVESASAGAAIEIANGSKVLLRRVSASTAGSGLAVTDAQDVRLDDCAFQAAADGIALTRVARCFVRNALFDGGAAGIRLNAGNSCLVAADNVFDGCGTGISGVAACGSDLLVRHNTFDGCTTAGIALAGGSRLNLKSNGFTAVAAGTVPVDLAVDTSVVADNVVRRAAAGGEPVDIRINAGSRKVTVNGNVTDGAIAVDAGATGVVQNGNLK